MFANDDSYDVPETRLIEFGAVAAVFRQVLVELGHIRCVRRKSAARLP